MNIVVESEKRGHPEVGLGLVVILLACSWITKIKPDTNQDCIEFADVMATRAAAETADPPSYEDLKQNLGRICSPTPGQEETMQWVGFEILKVTADAADADK